MWHWTTRLNDVAVPGRDRILTVLGPYHHGACARRYGSLHRTTRLNDNGAVPGRVRTITATQAAASRTWAVTPQYLGRNHSTLHWTTRINDDVAVPGRGGINTALGPHLRGTWAVTSWHLGHRIIAALRPLIQLTHLTVLSAGPHVAMTLRLSQVEAVTFMHSPCPGKTKCETCPNETGQHDPKLGHTPTTSSQTRTFLGQLRNISE